MNGRNRQTYVQKTQFPASMMGGRQRLTSSLSWYGRDRDRAWGKETTITRQSVADTVELARYVFFRHLPTELKPKYICYGNNAAPLAQAAAMLAGADGCQPEVYTLPSAGYSSTDAMHYGVEYSLSDPKQVEAYRDLFRAIGASPDAVVQASPQHPVIFVRPFGYTATSFRGLDEFMEQWVRESAQQRWPDNAEKQQEYCDQFCRNSRLTGIRSPRWYGEKNHPMIRTQWTRYAQAEELIIPERISRSVRSLRSVVWMPAFIGEGSASLSRLRHTDNDSFTEKTQIILDAMAQYIADGSLAQPSADISGAVHCGHIAGQYRRGVAHGNDSYLALLRRRGHEVDDETFRQPG